MGIKERLQAHVDFHAERGTLNTEAVLERDALEEIERLEWRATVAERRATVAETCVRITDAILNAEVQRIERVMRTDLPPTPV